MLNAVFGSDLNRFVVLVVGDHRTFFSFRTRHRIYAYRILPEHLGHIVNHQIGVRQAGRLLGRPAGFGGRFAGFRGGAGVR